MTWIEFLAQGAWKATVILALAFAASAALRRGPAAVRHFVWASALAAMVLLPLAIAEVPKWQWAAPAAAVAPPIETARQVLVVVGKKAAQWPDSWLLLWALGGMVAAARFLFGAGGTCWLVRTAAEAEYANAAAERLRQSLGIGRRVRVVESPVAPLPMMWGILRPVVVLPAGAASWSAARLEAVLLHELVHVHRLDLVAQTIGQAACCLYWFHPLAWIAARQLRLERERACDDAVLNRGLAASDYAQHLVDLVRGLAEKRLWGDAPAMAEANGLETRVRGLLDRTRNRKPLTRRAAAAVAAAGCAALVSLASVAAHAQVARGALAGVVKDPSGAVVPGCRVKAIALDGTNQETASTNPAGAYVFESIPPGRYALEFGSRGFKLGKTEVNVPAGQAARVDFNLELGQISEMVSVKGGKPVPRPNLAAGNAAAPQRIPVGGNVQAAKLLRQKRPEYPEELQQQGIQGTVTIRAVISKEGAVLNPAVVTTGVDARLSKLALDAVSQWLYSPTLLNGEPVEVVTTIDVAFELGQ